jgi:PqqD family protein of HPr-rel-A system
MEPLQKLHDLAVSDTGFVFDPYSGATFSVNATGRVILDALKEDLSRDEILARLEERFDVREDDLERDLGEFVETLRRNELLPREFSL